MDMTILILIALTLLTLGWALWVSTPMNFSTEKVITGRDGTADFTIDDGATEKHLKCILDMFRVREVIEMTTTDTFCTEGTADQDAGRSQLQFEIAGVLTKDGPLSGPMIPAPQKVAIKATYSAGCFISFTSNFTEAGADRVVNVNGRIGARGLSKGVYTTTWDIAP